MPRLRDDAADCARGYRTTPWLPYLPGPHSSPGAADVRRVQGARNVFSRAPALPCGSFESETGFVSGKARGQMDLLQRQLAPKCFCTHTARATARQALSRWCDPVMGGSPPGSAGVPPAQILPQLQPSPPPESTGSGALPLLRPGPCGSRRQGGRLQHRRETERQPKGQHAGGTPALPGGVVPMVRWGVSGGRLL